MPSKLKICHDYNKNERLLISKQWLCDYRICRSWCSAHQRQLFPLQKRGRKLRAIHPSLPQVEQHFRRQPSESQIGLLTACAVLRTDSRAQEQFSIPKGSASGIGGCQAHSGIKKAPTRRNLISPLRNSGKPRALFHPLMQREVNPQWETLQFTSPPALCIRSLCRAFLLAFADGKQKSFVWKWLTPWYAMIFCRTGQTFFTLFFVLS